MTWRNLAFLILTFVFASMTQAKIGDPSGVRRGSKIFCSHANTVFVLQSKKKKLDCNTAGAKRLWKTTLPFKAEPDQYNPNIEKDVQLCVVTGITFDGPDVLATNCQNKVFRLDRYTGKVKSEE